MANKEKIADGYIKHQGVTFHAATVAGMSEADFIKDAKAQADEMVKSGGHMNYSDMGAGQDDLLKGAWKAAVDANKGNNPEPEVPSTQNAEPKAKK